MLQTVASLLSFANLALIYINDDSCTPRQQFPSYTSLRPIQRPTRCMKYTATGHMNLKQVVEQVATSFAIKNSPIGAVQFERLPMEEHLSRSVSVEFKCVSEIPSMSKRHIFCINLSSSILLCKLQILR